MKKLIFALLALVVSGSAAQAVDKPIQVNQLPQKAQAFIQKHFAGVKMLSITVDNELLDSDYTVVFDNGSDVDFDKKGEWTEVECRTTAVPEAIIPAEIRSFLNSSHKGDRISKIERDRVGYEISIPNDVTLKFDTKGCFVGYDD